MKRYSVAPSSVRRNTVMSGIEESSAAEELERLEQETTLVLQEIDKNISRGNAIINDRLIPLINEYSNDSKKVWENTGFWKSFFEQSANVELDSYEEPIVNTTEVNTLANRNSIYHEDDINTPKQTPDPKKDEATATWTTDQLKRQSSTPRVHKKPVFLPTAQYESSKDEDSSAEIEVPKMSDDAQIRVQTLRQSLDAYHKISISPKKNTPRANKRSSMIQELLNSSPTLPEPPVLRSEIDAADIGRIPETGSLSPVILPPELSPLKSPIKENTLQRFPTTPKFSERLSGGLGSSSSAVKPLVYGDDDSELAPPELHITEKTSQATEDPEEAALPPPDLQTIDLGPPTKKPRQENVFLESENSTMYHSVKEHTNGSSKSISNLFEEIASRLDLPIKSKETEKVSNANDIFRDNLSQEKNEGHDDTQDQTENSTSELGATLRERFRNLTSYGRRTSIQESDELERQRG